MGRLGKLGQQNLILCAMLISAVFAFTTFVPVAFADDEQPIGRAASQETVASAGQHYQALSDSAQRNQSNLVLFVKFSGDASNMLNESYTYSEGYTLSYSNFQYLKDDFNTGSYGRSSLQAYLSMASNGAYNVTSYFPQQVADSTIKNSSGASFSAQQVTYIQLDKTEAYYRGLGESGDASLVGDVCSKFNAAYSSYDASQLDADGDGSMDNVTFVYQLQAAPTSQDDVFWPHMYSQKSLGTSYAIGAKNLSTYNFLYVYASPDDTQKISLGISPGVAVHEYLHTLGLQDYYNNTLQAAGGSPVSPWDIMADKSYNYFMLSNTRKLLGWTTIPDISQAATAKVVNPDKSTTYTCTLYKPFSSSGSQSVDLYTSLNSSEHFVFEYRQKTSLQSNPLQPDSSLYINNSGLIIYRVNESVTSKSNFHDATNPYVYVFRPGETGTNAAGGNTFESTLETPSYAVSGLTYGARDAFGKSDLAATPAVTDGDTTGNSTIYYADGSNSGVMVKVTAQTSDSITFDVTVPDYSSLGLWDQVGVAADTGVAGDTSIAVGNDGAVYQLYRNTDTGALVVRSWNGVTWTDRGTVATGTESYAPKLKCVGSALYCVYSWFAGGSGNAVVCKKLSGTTWTDVGTIPTGSSYCYTPAPAAIDGALAVLVDKDNANAQLYTLGSGGFTTTGSTLPVSFLLAPSIVSVGGKIYVTCGDFNEVGMRIYQLSNGIWQIVYASGLQIARPTAAIAVGTTLVAFSSEDSDNAKKLVTIASDGTQKTFTFDKVGGGIISANFVYDGTNVYLMVLDGSGIASVWCATANDLSSWAQLGADAYTKASSVEMASDGKSIYVGVASSDTSAATVVSHTVQKASTPTLATYAITASADAGGTITPSGTVAVKSGQSQTYAITPSSGYKISDVQVDGVSVGAVASYAFKSIIAAHAIHASFTPVEDAAPTPTTTTPALITTYRTHVQDYGWQNGVLSAASNVGTSGTTGSSKRLEGIYINVIDSSGTTVPNVVEYSTHVQNIGWQDFVAQNQMAGTTGKSYRLEAIRIRLTSAYASQYDVYYRVHAQNVGWLDWASDGEESGTAGYSYRLEAIQIILVQKGAGAPAASPASATPEHFQSLKYQTHVQNVGWQDWVTDGDLSGTTGRSLRLEGICISLGASEYFGGITYKTHVQDIGWQGWKSDGDMSGTSGRALRLEAICIKLTGEMAANYDVYYRVHVQNFGWTGWAFNGESCGSAGYGYRLEGIQIQLVPAGGSAPGSTANIFHQR